MTDSELLDTEPENVAEATPAGSSPARVLRVIALAALLFAAYAALQFGYGATETETAGGSGRFALEIGSEAPDFTVRTFDDGEFSLSRHLESDGRPVFVNMWAEWCFPCRAEMPAIDAVAAAHPEVHFIGVVVNDDEEPARRFVEDYDIRYQIGLDDDRAVKEAYGIWAMPSTYLIDADGVIVDRVFGPMREAQLEESIAKVSRAGSG